MTSFYDKKDTTSTSTSTSSSSSSIKREKKRVFIVILCKGKKFDRVSARTFFEDEQHREEAKRRRFS